VEIGEVKAINDELRVTVNLTDHTCPINNTSLLISLETLVILLMRSTLLTLQTLFPSFPQGIVASTSGLSATYIDKKLGSVELDISATRSRLTALKVVTSVVTATGESHQVA
jgi:hypothetical protein